MANAGVLWETHRAAGAIFAEREGRQVPLHYGDWRAEYDAVRKTVGLVDLSHLGKLRIGGGDGRDFLHRMLTNDVKSLAAGRGCRAFLLNPKGHVVADLSLYALEDACLAEAEPSMATAAREMLARYIIADDVTLEDVSEALALLSVQGPAAPAVLAALLRGEAPHLEPFQHVECRLADTRARVAAYSRTGEAGYDVWVPADHARPAWEAIAGAGGGQGLRPVGLEALEVLRLEAGHAWAADLAGDVLAMETGLEQEAVSFTKGCYIGQEFVVRVAHRGHVNRRLSGLALNGDRVPAAGDKVTAGEREVGAITSAAFSPALGRAIALGYLRREYLALGSSVEVQAASGPLQAEVVALPFVKGVR